MGRKTSMLVIIILIMSLAAGCSSSNGNSEVKEKAKIKGVVTSGKAGPKLANVSITMEGYSTKTNHEGEFSFLVPEGTYNVNAAKEEWGTSKYQEVKATSDSPTQLEMVMLKENGVNNFTPPAIKINGIQPGKEISGEEKYKVKVDSQNSINGISIYHGKQGYQNNYYYPARKEVEVKWDTNKYPQGKSYLIVKAKDANNNIAKKKVPVKINNSETTPENTLPPTPKNISVSAITFGKAREDLYTTKLSKLVAGFEKTDKEVPKDTTLFVLVKLPPVNKADGYIIERSYKGKQYEKIAQIPKTMVSSKRGYVFYDMGAQLTPGQRTYYKVKTYNQTGVSSATKPLVVIPLPKANVKLKSPGDNATGVSLAPTFNWEITREPKSYTLAGQKHSELFMSSFSILESTGANFIKNKTIINKQQLSFANKDIELEAQTEYEWDIGGRGIITYNGKKDGDGFMVQAISAYGYKSNSLNGGFRFITGN